MFRFPVNWQQAEAVKCVGFWSDDTSTNATATVALVVAVAHLAMYVCFCSVDTSTNATATVAEAVAVAVTMYVGFCSAETSTNPDISLFSNC